MGTRVGGGVEWGYGGGSVGMEDCMNVYPWCAAGGHCTRSGSTDCCTPSVWWGGGGGGLL